MGLEAGKKTLSVNATGIHPKLPIYGIDVDIVPGQITQLGTLKICPPLPPERFTPLESSSDGQIITDPQYPGVALHIPAGATITGWDGKLKTQMAIQKLMPDQLPVPPPPGTPKSLYQPMFGTPMGGLPTAPIGVTLPNEDGLAPGEQTELWSYDAAPFPGVPGAWRYNGLGTVSEDGATITSDPGVGITRFCGVCGLSCFIKRQDTQPNLDPDDPTDGDPVNLMMGQMVPEKTDLILPGRIPAVIHRTYNPYDPFGGVAGFAYELGHGWALSVEVVLQAESTSLRRLIMPGNSRFSFTARGDGTFVNSSHQQRWGGAVLTDLGAGTHVLRLKDGTLWHFNPAGGLANVSLLGAVEDRYGNTLTIEHDASNKISRLVEPSGRELTFTHTSGRLTEVADPIGRTVRYTYTANGRLATVTDPAGGVTSYTYDGSDRILTVTDPRGIDYVRNEYSSGTGNLLRQYQADGAYWDFRYRIEYSVCTLYASGNRLAALAIGGCSGGDVRSKEERYGQEFDPSAVSDLLPGSVRIIGVTVVDPRGNPTRYMGNDEVIDALGQRTVVTRDSMGQVISVTDALGRVTRFEYDEAGNLIERVDPGGNIYRFEYEPSFNRITTIVAPAAENGEPGSVTTFEYDQSGNLISITDPQQNLAPEGAPLKTYFQYDEFGQRISVTNALGNSTLFAYDPQGDLVSITDALGNTLWRSFDPVSRIVAQTDPRGRTSQFTYDDLSRLTAVADRRYR